MAHLKSGDLSSGHEFSANGGGVGALMRGHHWSRSALPAPERWPLSLTAMAGFVLSSGTPMFIVWGEELALLYNDAYSAILGDRHPEALGRPAREVWPDIWDDIAPLLHETLNGTAIFREDVPFDIRRRQRLERAWFTFSYTPLRDDEGNIAGIHCSLNDTTAKVLAEHQRVEQVERLRELFKQAPSMMAVVSGPDHVYELVNDNYLALMGRSNLIGKRVRDAVPELASQGFIQLLDKVYETGEPYIGRGVPIQVQRGDGYIERFIDFIYQPIVDREGNITGIFGEGVDVTEAVTATRALKASEERLRLATEAAGLGLWLWDVETDTPAWESERLYEVFGCPREEGALSASRFASEFVHPDDAEIFRHALSAAIETDERFHFTGRFYRGNDRELRWIEMTGYLQSGSDGRARCLLGTAADITERKNAEVREKTAAAEARAAAEANAKFRVFFEQGSYFAGVMALDGTVLEANDVSLEACGFRREDVIGRKFWECGWWSPSGELMEMIKAASALAADGKIFRKETPYFIADGSQRVVDLILAPVTDHNGHILYIAPTGTDITERKQVEERLRLLDALGELTRSASDPHAVMSATTRLLGQHLKASRCAYADVDDDNDRFTIRDDWNADGISTTAGVYSLDLFGPRAATGLREGRTLIINDVDAELAPHEGADMFNAIGIKAIITCPLVKQGRLAAMMAVHHRTPRRWTQEEILLVQEVVERSWAHIERVRSVEALKDSETKSANALAIARLGTFDWNMSNNEVQSSQRTKEIFSLNAEEARRAEAYFSRIHPDDVERVRREIEAALEVDGRLHTQYRIRLPDGAVRHIVSMSACQRDAFGAWSRHIGVFDDVTEQKHAEAALRDSEAHLSSIFEQTAVGIAEADLNGQLLRVNDQYCRILDRNREEIVGHYMQEFTHPDHLGHNLSLLEQMMRDGQAFELEKQYLRPDGTGVWVGVTVSLIKGHSEQPSGSLLAVAIDITQRKQAEDRLRDADRRKDEFLAMLAHELRNPLAPIKAAADILQMGRFDEARVKQTSEIISRQARHMASLVDDLLDVSRVTRGLVTLEKETLDTKRIVSDAIEQVRPLIETRRHHLAVHMPPESASVMGDKKRLVQVVANILNNAAKYTPEGGQISLRMEVQDGHVMLTVSDNGIGMSADLTQRAFELFAQAERTSDRSQGGLGIGLALVKSLVELHGGHVTAFSEGAGKGSRFTICLPLQAEQEAGATAQHHDALPRAPAKPLKIMVVDDNVDAARMLAMFSETLGHDVVVEHSSEKALARAGEEKPDVYLLDIGLPGMDGNELARRLRAHPSAADAVLVAVTGYGQEQDRKGALNAGFDHHFVKPVDTRRLAQLLSEIS